MIITLFLIFQCFRHSFVTPIFGCWKILYKKKMIFRKKIMYKKVTEKEKLFYCKYLILNSIQNIIIWLNKFQYHTANASIELDHYKQISREGLELLSAHGDSAMAGPSPWRSMGFVPSYSERFNNYSFLTTLNTWAIRNKNNNVAQLAVSLKSFWGAINIGLNRSGLHSLKIVLFNN